MSSGQTPALDWGGPVSRAYPGFGAEWLERPVFERFSVQMRKCPEAVAVRDLEGALTYAELHARALAVGCAVDAAVEDGAPVALALSVDRRYPAAILGALAAGRPYVPLDLSFPAQRLQHILLAAGVRLVLVDTRTRARLQAMLPDAVACLEVDDLAAADGAWQPCGQADANAYVLYTSGSSGLPKGVFQNQRGLTHDVSQYTQAIHLGPEDVLSGLYSPSVGGAIRDLFGALLNGATLAMVDLRSAGLREAEAALREWGVTVFHAMPPVLRAFLRQVDCRAALAAVRLAYVAGDQFFASDLALLRRFLPAGAYLYTGIGSTEVATLYRHWFIPATWKPAGTLVPVGHALPDRHITIVDPAGQPVPAGSPGEVVVSGAFLSRGYWKDKVQTHARFSPDPDRPGMRRYRTGDLGRLCEDGLLEFLGRADRQVKIRGYRVEPAQTEGMLRALSGVRDAAVLVRRRQQVAEALVAYVVLDDARIEQLRQQLAQVLPAHQCPGEIVALPALPMLGNFKLDYAALAALDAQSQVPAAPADGGHGVAAADRAATVDRVWRKVLGPDAVDDRRRFVDAGGDSLKALELHVALERALGMRLPVDWFESEATLASLRTRVLADRGMPVIAADLTLVLFPGYRGVDMQARMMEDALGRHFGVLQLEYPSIVGIVPGSLGIDELAAACLPQVQERMAGGERVVLLGASFGGRVAYAAAMRLQALGLEPALLVLGDVAREYLSMPVRLRGLQRWKSRFSRALVRSRVLVPGALLRWICAGVYASRSHTLRKLNKLCASLLIQRRIEEWAPGPYRGPVCLLVTHETRTEYPDLTADLGWAGCCCRLVTASMPGMHADMYKPQNTAMLVATIGDALTAARALEAKARSEAA